VDRNRQLGSPRRALVGTLAYVELGGFIFLWLPILAVLSRVHRHDPVRRVPGRWIRKLGRTIGRFSPLWRFSTDGEPPADIHERAYVVVANHQSNADPFLLANLPWDMRWIAKEELAKWPVAGWAFKWGGDIFFRRGHRPSIVRMMKACRETLDNGLSLMIFPEGTRSRDGELLPFKAGAFSLAVEKQVPILPVVLQGTRNCIPRGSPWLGEARAHARILEPVSTEGLGADDVEALTQQVRERMVAARAELIAQMPELTGARGELPPG